MACPGQVKEYEKPFANILESMDICKPLRNQHYKFCPALSNQAMDPIFILFKAM